MKDKNKDLRFLTDLKKLFNEYGVELVQIPCCDELVITEIGKYRFDSDINIEINKDLISVLRYF